MKFKDYVLESIIDIPRLTYAPGVFDNANTSNPKIKASVKKLINNQIKEFEQDYPILKISLILKSLSHSCFAIKRCSL